MAATVVVVSVGEMGVGIARRLRERGANVRTSLKGRSPASVERASRAGIAAIDDDAALVAGADFFLSVLPPGEAVALARRFAPALAAAQVKPVYADCNAIAPATAVWVGEVIAQTGGAYVDIGIIGAPPKSEGPGPRLYASGTAANRLLALRDFGLDIRVVDETIGSASALKCSYAGMTKGLQAIASAQLLAATRAGVADALRAELAQSQPAISEQLQRQLPTMYAKAYRWVAEMDEIGDFHGDTPGAGQIYHGMARLYELLAEAHASRGTPGNAVDLLEAFLKPAGR